MQLFGYQPSHGGFARAHKADEREIDDLACDVHGHGFKWILKRGARFKFGEWRWPNAVQPKKPADNGIEFAEYSKPKFHIVRHFLRSMMLAKAALLLMAVSAGATSFNSLYSFSASDFYNVGQMPPSFNDVTNDDGAAPYATVVLSGSTLYGTTVSGGTNGYGTVYAINTDGTGFTNLHNFNGVDGANPLAGLMLHNNIFYGTTVNGGSNGAGTVFAINANGTGFTNLHSFTTVNFFSLPGIYSRGTNCDGANPCGGLVANGNTLYGTTLVGGTNGYGMVFAINTDGTGFTNIYDFTAPIASGFGYTNRDGFNPVAALTLSGQTLYGTVPAGGNYARGVLFAINTDGTGFTNFHNFSGSDGYYPHAGLMISGNILYGTALQGGNYGAGTVFAVNTDGTGFTNLYNFNFDIGPQGEGPGAPAAVLVLSGNTLYGTASQGGNAVDMSGTVFALNTNGTAFTNLYCFSGPDGSSPVGGVVISGHNLYGTTRAGGSDSAGYGSGTVFALNLLNSIPLNIQPVNDTVILSWTDPTFSLQAATNVTGVYTNVPGATSPFTNVLSDSQMFYRLQAN